MSVRPEQTRKEAELMCAHLWTVIDKYVVYCERCRTTLGVGVTDTSTVFGPGGTPITDDLPIRAQNFARALADTLNANSALASSLSSLEAEREKLRAVKHAAAVYIDTLDDDGMADDGDLRAALESAGSQEENE